MPQVKNQQDTRKGRLFPEIQWSTEQIAQSKAKNQATYQHCRIIFERIKPQFIQTHYNWFVAIDPNSEEYYVEKDEQVAIQKLHHKHPDTIPIIFKINDTGACGTI